MPIGYNRIAGLAGHSLERLSALSEWNLCRCHDFTGA